MPAAAKGRPKGSTDKPWAEALRIASTETDESGKRRLRALAEKTWQLAIDGDMQAIKEIGDRIDGKAAQTVDIKHDPSDAFLTLLELLTNGPRLADSMAGEQGQSAPVRH